MNDPRLQSIQKPADPNWAKIETCTYCNNHYVVLWLEHSPDWNDFGYRYCPFCGWAFDEITGAVVNDVL